MNKEELKQFAEKERAAFKSFLKSTDKEYFVECTEKLGPNNLCVCDIVLADIPSKWKLIRNYLLCRIAESIPLSGMKISIYKLLGAKIGKRVFIAPRTYIDSIYPELLTIEDDALIGVGARIFVHEYTQKGFRIGRVLIKKNAVIGAYAILRSSVTIGEGSLVGMASFVNKDVPDNSVVAGNPAKPIEKNREEP